MNHVHVTLAGLETVSTNIVGEPNSAGSLIAYTPAHSLASKSLPGSRCFIKASGEDAGKTKPSAWHREVCSVMESVLRELRKSRSNLSLVKKGSKYEGKDAAPEHVSPVLATGVAVMMGRFPTM